MKTPKEILNEVAERNAYHNWGHLMYSMGHTNLNKYIDEAILEYAKQCCEAQRESDAKAAKINNGEESIDSHRCKVGTYMIDIDSILNNPLVTDKID